MDCGPKEIILVNMIDTASEVLSDVLAEWGYLVHHLSSDEFTISSFKNTAMIIYHLEDFSCAELETCRRLRTMIREIPLVATAPLISMNEVFALARAGVTTFLPQPIIIEDLKRILTNCRDCPTSLMPFGKILDVRN